MLRFLLNRFAQALVVLFVISVIAFIIQGQIGDPLRELVGQSVSEAEREKLREELGLKDPLFVQYGRFLAKAVRGDLGQSYFFKRPALDVIGDKFPATFELVLGTTVIVLLISVPAGVYCAIRRRSWLSRLIMSASIIGISIPVFLTAIFAIYLFAVTLNWLPSYGRGEDLVQLGGWSTGLFTADGIRHLVLPCLSLATIMLPLFIRLIRAEMLDTMTQDYIRTAKAKGLPDRTIWFRHALKNTLLPVLSVGGVQIGTLLAYTILTERVFNWPGMGFLFLEAVERVDTPLIVAYLMVVGLIFVATNTIVDLLYMWVNPTVDAQGGAA